MKNNFFLAKISAGLLVGVFFIGSIGANELKKSSADKIQDLFELARDAQKSFQVSKAIICYQKIIGLSPTQADAWLELGNSWYQKGDISDALHAYRKALEFKPDSSIIHYNIGLCLRTCDKMDEAINCFQKAINLQPDHALSYFNCYQLYKKQGNDAKAFEMLQEGVKAVGKDALLNHTIGTYYCDQNQLEKAVEHLRVAAAHEPGNITYLQDLANALCMINCYDEALMIYQKIFEMDTSIIGALYNIGYVLRRLGHINEAIQVYSKVLSVTPDNGCAHFALGMAYLCRAASDEDWINGWKEYEWRWSAYQEPQKQYNNKPFWEGSDIAGKTVLVIAEQGFGDVFQFIRYTKELKVRGAHVIFYCPSAIKTFMKVACETIDEVICGGDPMPRFDYQIYLMSLPCVLNTVEKTVPQDIPYLKADKQLVQQWAERLSSDKHIKIGLCWQGNANYSTQALRQVVAAKSISLKALMTSLSQVPGCSFYSLQKMGGEEQLKDMQEISIRDFGQEFDVVHGRFVDTAAVMMNLDIVITVDTSIAHLAAALGVPTWILLPTPADWRWMMNRLDTPWYPKVRLFRQPSMGDWEGLLDDVVVALNELVKEKANTPSQEMVAEKMDGDTTSQNASGATSHSLLSAELFNLPTPEFLDQLTLRAMKYDAEITCLLTDDPEREKLVNEYRSRVEKFPELSELAQGLYAANCYLVAAMKSLSTDVAVMRSATVDMQIADLKRAQKIKKLLKSRIAQIIQ